MVDHDVPFGVELDLGEGDEWRILAHDAADTTLYNLNHLGGTMPANADCHWVGSAGPGPSLIDSDGGNENAYARKTASWMAHTLVHFARMLKQRPIPAEGNVVPDWQGPKGEGPS